MSPKLKSVLFLHFMALLDNYAFKTEISWAESLLQKLEKLMILVYIFGLFILRWKIFKRYKIIILNVQNL